MKIMIFSYDFKNGRGKEKVPEFEEKVNTFLKDHPKAEIEFAQSIADDHTRMTVLVKY